MSSRLAAPAIALALAILLVAEGIALDTTWLSEEVAIAEQARGGPSFVPASSTAYPLLLRPLADLLAGGWLLWLGRVIGALAWAAIAVLTYRLARRECSAQVAAVAAVLAALVPAAVYATALLPEALATLLAALSLALFLRAQAAAARPALEMPFALALAAALLRPWFAVLLPVLAVAAVAGSLPWRELRVWPRPLALVLLAGFAYIGVEGASPELERALLEPGAVLRAAAASLAVAALGTGVVPWLLAGARLTSRSAGAGGGVIFAAAVALALAAGVSSAAGAGERVDERPLLALAPFVFAAAARGWAAGLPSTRALVVAGVVLAASVLTIPVGALGEPTLHDAPGAELAGRVAGGLGHAAPAVLALAVACLTALVAAARLQPVASAALTLALLVPGHVIAWRAVSLRSSAEAARLPSPRDWLDRWASDEGEVSVLLTPGPFARPGPGLRQLALWNRSLGPLLLADPAQADPSTGRLPAAPGTPFVLALGVDVVGEVVERRSLAVLVRIEQPLRLAVTTEGIYPDGWSAERAVYRRFSGAPTPGTVTVTVSRPAGPGPDVPRTVIFSAGRFGRSRSVGGIVIHAEDERRIPLRVPPAPFEVVITVDPTFLPSEFGEPDARRLGVQLTFTYAPDPP